MQQKGSNMKKELNSFKMAKNVFTRGDGRRLIKTKNLIESSFLINLWSIKEWVEDPLRNANFHRRQSWEALVKPSSQLNFEKCKIFRFFSELCSVMISSQFWRSWTSNLAKMTWAVILIHNKAEIVLKEDEVTKMKQIKNHRFDGLVTLKELDCNDR